jgi:hypothetical protein
MFSKVNEILMLTSEAPTTSDYGLIEAETKPAASKLNNEVILRNALYVPAAFNKVVVPVTLVVEYGL